ncbi:MAG: hypothetical protein AAB562_03490 [Patescibacteria group bacterium]|mgnify:CR=1 FL=1
MSTSETCGRILAALLPLGVQAFLATACETPCFPNYARNITAYVVEPNAETPGGIAVDESGFPVDLAAVDGIVDALEVCLGEEIPRECLTVKIAPDWYVSPCSGAQLFPCDIPQTRCANATPDCPCRCAGTVQDNTVAVTTPNLASLAHEVTHIVTGLPDPFPPEVAACADGIVVCTP